LPVKMVSEEWGRLSVKERLSQNEIEIRVRDLLSQMTLNEKINQMAGDLSRIIDGIPMLWAYNYKPMPAGENKRLGIPGIRFTDGPRGVVMNHATCFPVSMARGATWDVDLEERIGDAIGVEARSLGANFFGGVCINLLRHPAWGRAQETYGEDPYLLGEMGAALTRGVQRHVMACAKHYALNSIENSRFKVNVKVDERTLREVYLPHFKRCVDEGVASIMSAYNRVNGDWCGEHEYLLRKVLKEEWGFNGFVMSDFVYGVHDSKSSAMNGLDVEMPFALYFGRKLRRLVEKGEVSEAVIDDSVTRILRQQIRFAQVGEMQRYGPESVASEAHKDLAREAAQKSMVLLKNDVPVGGEKPLLPLKISEGGKLALIGRLAAKPNTGDKGSSKVRTSQVVTPLEGLKAAGGSFVLTYDSGRNIDRAAEIARQADAVVVVVGYTYKDEGEYFTKPFSPVMGGDRQMLSLLPHDEQLILALARANHRVVVVMMGGSAIITEAWREQVAAILMAWYPGMQGGYALADILLGRVNPSGKLPCTFPMTEEQLPFFKSDVDEIVYGYYHGYRLLDKSGKTPAFPFGFGLSYTTFNYSNLRLENAELPLDGILKVSVDITNTGEVPGEEVVQLYIGSQNLPVDSPPKVLKAFQRLVLQPGETRTVEMCVPTREMTYYDVQNQNWVVAPVAYNVFVGASSAASDLLSARFYIAA
jgi:beta-glucosidase